MPLNPDYRSAELGPLLEHGETTLVVAPHTRAVELRGIARTLARPASVLTAEHEGDIPHAPQAKAASPEASAILYTSGTTGNPKGCMLDDGYFLAAGRWYLTEGGLCVIRRGEERMLTPLPLFHMNAMAFSFMATVLSAGCLILLDRFHPKTWWETVAAQRGHAVRFGFGAGVDPTHHEDFETRFGFPLIEVWAMTETGAGACIAASREPRHVGTRCFGRPRPTEVEIRVVDEADNDAEADMPGELLVRHAGPDAQKGFFRGYLKDRAASAEAWRDGWFHTGDVVRRGPDGSLHFVDRRKNLIRRSGENISALEVEGVLALCLLVRAIAVLAIPDAMRGEEVMALVVARDGVRPDKQTAAAIVAFCRERLAYYKAPGYVAFVEELPVMGTQKVQKSRLGDLLEVPERLPVCFDLRREKRRCASA